MAGFRYENEAAFETEFSQKAIAPDGSSLADNIVAILERLATFPTTLQHVALIFHRKVREKPNGVVQCGVPFKLVTFHFDALNQGGLFSLSAAGVAR